MRDDVKALAERFINIRIEHFDFDGDVMYDEGFGYLTESSAEALARVALEFCEKRRWERIAETLAARDATSRLMYYPATDEWLPEDEWRKRVFTEKGEPLRDGNQPKYMATDIEIADSTRAAEYLQMYRDAEVEIERLQKENEELKRAVARYGFSVNSGTRSRDILIDENTALREQLAKVREKAAEAVETINEMAQELEVRDRRDLGDFHAERRYKSVWESYRESGRALAEALEEPKKRWCPRCNGTGNVNHENKGHLVNPNGSPNGPRSYTLEHRECPECNGTGYKP